MPLFSEQNIISAKAFAIKKCKATVQQSGKLGFSSVAAELMKLSPSCGILLSDCMDGNLAVVVLHDSTDPRSFAVRKTTNYYSADLKGFFDSIGVDYASREHTVIYDIVQMQETYHNLPVFKLTRRIKKRRLANGSALPMEVP